MRMKDAPEKGNRIDPNRIKITQLDSRYTVEINGSFIDNVKSYHVSFDSSGCVEINLVISTHMIGVDSDLVLAQPPDNCRCNCASNP